LNKKARVVVINLALLFAGVLVAEGVARLGGVTPSSVDPSLPMELGNGPKNFGRAYPRGYFVANEARGFDIAPGFAPLEYGFFDGTMNVFSNRYGCLDRNDAVASPYVLVLGDSFAWGYAPYETKWGTLLEKKLGVPVAKCGVTHSGQLHQLSKGRDVVAALGAPPRLVVVSYYINDPVDDLLFPQATVIEGFLTDQNRLVDGAVQRLGHDALMERYRKWQSGDLTQANLDSPSGRPGLLRRSSVVASLFVRLSRDFADRRDRKKVEAASTLANRKGIDGLADWTHAIGARLLFVLIPPREMKRDYYVDLKGYLDGKSIAYLDLYPTFKARPGGVASYYWPVDIHWTPQGNAAVADLVEAEIKSRFPETLTPP
jgi:hypothetical protein